VKNFVFAIMMFCGLAAFSQEVKTVSILTNPADTTFKLYERTTLNGEETFTRTFPERWLTWQQLAQYIFQIAKEKEASVVELERLKINTIGEKEFFVAAFDTLSGKDAYLTARKEELQKFMQGNWTLLVQGKNPIKYAVVITDNVVSSGDKEGTINVFDGVTVTVTIPDIMPVGVDFTLHNNDVLQGKEGKVGYVLRR